MADRKSLRRLCTLLTVLATLAGVRTASADTLTVAWDLSTTPEVTGYVVHIGTQPGTYTQTVDVGNTDRFVFTSALPGQQYCFAVKSYAGGTLSEFSNEACGVSNGYPFLDQPADQTSTVGQNVSLQLNGGDPQGQPVTYSATGLPPGLLISQTIGLVSGVPVTAGSYNVTVTVSDGALSVSRTFTWTIGAANQPPTLANPGDQTSDSGSAVILQLQGSDPEGGTLTYSASGLPPGLALTAGTGRIAGTPSTVGSYNVSVSVSDGSLSASRSFTWTIRSGNVAPVLTNPGTQTTDVSTPVSLQLQAADANGDSLTYAAAGLPTGVQLSQATGVITGTPTVAASYTVSVTVSDGILSDSETFTWNVRTVNAAPTLQNPGNQTAEEGAFVILNLQGADANGDPLTYSATGLPAGLQLTQSSGRIAGTPTAPGSYDVTASVSDGTLTASQSFTWVVRARNAAPVLTTPSDQLTNVNTAASLQVQATDANGDTLSYVAAGLPTGLTIASNTGLISGSPTLAGIYAVEVSVSDGVARVSASFTWTVQETSSSTNVSLSNPGTQRSNVGQAISLQLRSNSPGTLVFSASNLPPGLAVDGSTGVIAGTPTTPGTYTVAISVSDGTSTATQGFTWIIRGNNEAPVLTNPGAQTHQVGDAVLLQLQATDSNNDTLTYAATGLPAGLQIDAVTGRITGFPATTGSSAVTVSVSDAAATATQAFTWTIVAANTAPTLGAPGNQTSTVGEADTLQLAGADADGDTLTYSATGLPGGLQIDASTGQISGTPAAAGSYSVVAIVSDGTLSASRPFTWTVLSANTAPTLVAPGNQTGTTGQAAQLQLQGADPDGDALVYAATGLPPGLQVNAATGAIAGTPTTAGTYSVTASVTDGALSASRPFTWTIADSNVAPTLSVLAAQSTVEGDAAMLEVQASDPNGDQLSYSASGLPPGLQMSSSTGRISGTPTAPGDYAVTVVVSDGVLTAQRSFGWTIVARPVNPNDPGEPSTLLTRRTSSAVYTGTSASLRPAPGSSEPVRQYTGTTASSRTPATTTAPVTPEKQYTGTAALTRTVSEAPTVPMTTATYTGTAAMVRDLSSSETTTTTTLETSSALTRSVATSQGLTGSSAGSDAGISTDTSMTAAGSTTAGVSAPHGAPSVSIHTPVDHARFAEGATVIFSGIAQDVEDGTLSHTIVWSSSVDGRLGTGALFTRVLSTGTHIVTAQVTDSAGNVRRAQITVLIGED